MIGERLGPYRILRRLGRGGMGEVFEAEPDGVAGGRTVALKVLAGEYAATDEDICRFQREGRLLHDLAHPGIVPALSQIAVDRGCAYFAMEFVPGRDLRELIKSEAPLAPARVVAIAGQVLEALAFAHAHGVVHRDVTPGNVLLDRDERVRLADFGLARVAGLPSVTKTGIALGTPAYMAPEQLGTGEPDGRTDLYALGVILYEMLSGRPPFDAKQPMQVAKMHLEAKVPPIDAPVPKRLEAVVRRALAKTQRERFPGADEMREALRDAIAAPGSGSSSGERAADVEGRQRAIVLVVLVLITIAAIAVVISGL